MSMYEGEVVVTLHDFPPSVQGALSIDNDGTPCIHLNANLSLEAQRKAYDHEMSHLVNDDFDTRKSIESIED